MEPRASTCEAGTLGLCCATQKEMLAALGKLHCGVRPVYAGELLSIQVGCLSATNAEGMLLTASRSLSMIVSSSSKCRSLISNFFIWVSTSKATRDLIFLSSTAAKC